MSKRTNNIFYIILCIIFISNILGILAYIFKVTGKNTGTGTGTGTGKNTGKDTGKDETKYINKYLDIEGGDIYEDIVDGKTYKIHKFTNNLNGVNDTFNIGTKETLVYEVLIIGGGGGGGGSYMKGNANYGGSGGGGGGGEYKIQIINLLPSNYIIHIGKGGNGGVGNSAGSIPADGTKGEETYIKSTITSTDTNLITCYGGDEGKGTPKILDMTENAVASDGGRNGNCNHLETWSNCFTGGKANTTSYGPLYASGGGAGSDQKGSDGVRTGSMAPIGGNGGEGYQIPAGWGPDGEKEVCGGGGGGATPDDGSQSNSYSYGGNGRYGGGNGFGRHPDNGPGSNGNGDGGNATNYGAGGGGSALSWIDDHASGGTPSWQSGGKGSDGLVLIRYRIA